MRVRCMQQVASWIVLPSAVTFEASLDGEKWTLVSTETHGIPIDGAGPLVHAFIAHPQAPLQARYVRVVLHNSGKLPAWHLGAGSDSWVFADEVIVR